VSRGLQLVKPKPPERRKVRFPVGPWYDWFAEEFGPLRSPAVDSSAEYRRRVTRESPLRFAMVYLDHHLTLQDSVPPTVTFSEFHLALCRSAARLQQPVPWREGWIAPRGIGKSVWSLLVLPLWALAHGHRSFFLVASHTEAQAMAHLQNLRMELDNNQLLRDDFPELAPLKTRGARNTQTTVVSNGGTFEAVGLGATILGRRAGTDRPNLVTLDDIEPLEESYSPEQRAAQLRKILVGILPMTSAKAAIGIFGTVTMYRSITHDFVIHGKGREHVDWIADNRFTPRVFPAIIENPDGSLRSLWPDRWPLTETHLGEHKIGTREFDMNFMLDPRPDQVGRGGGFWLPDTFTYMDPARFSATEYALVIDPALKTGKDNDFTAIAVIGRTADRRRAIVEHASHGHWSGEQIRQRIHLLAGRNPDLRTLIFEENAGGAEHWAKVLEPRDKPLPRQFGPAGQRVRWQWAKGHKITRAKAALAAYERGQVFHARRFAELEEEMLRFPDPGAHDDLIDCVAAGLRWALED
jgi:phage terminase large subunit-like protein